MVKKRLTLFELHVDGDVQFGPKTLPGDESGGEAQIRDDAETVDDESTSPAKKGVAALIGLVALIAMAVVVKKLLGGGDDPEIELAESDQL